MDKAKKTPTTLLEAVTYFSDFENCKDYMVQLRWGKGKVTCPRCGSDNVSYLPNARVFKCYEKHSLAKFSLKVGTIFEDSPIPLEKWLPVMWMLVNCKNGVSSWEIHRAIGVTQKSAWFMLQRGRLAMQDELTGGMLNGEVEIDETFIGGKVRNMHKSKKVRLQKDSQKGNKTAVLGMLERGGRVRASVVPDRTKATIQEHVSGNVEVGSELFSDEYANMWRMDEEYKHQIVNHATTYVMGNIHTNGLENFWALLKRGLHGTYISVEPFHLFRYIDEQAFRFNNRGPMNDSQRFSYVMRKIVGKRLTYAELIGKVDERPAEEEVEPF
jgi:transposase-like protein